MCALTGFRKSLNIPVRIIYQTCMQKTFDRMLGDAQFYKCVFSQGKLDLNI